MFLNFLCPACDNEIQSEYQHIGSWVACPLCSFEQVVPDPPLASNSSYNGYHVESLLESNMLYLGYKAKSEQSDATAPVLLRIPTSFFLKNISDFESFVHAVGEAGTPASDGHAKLLDKSLVHGKVFFVYELLPEGRPLSELSSPASPFKIVDTVIFAKRFATAMDKAWTAKPEAHLNLNPSNIMTNSKLEIEIFDSAISAPLLNDPQLISNGFNIWDMRYMSPENRAGKYDFKNPAGDIYSLGALLSFMLTGKHPFEDAEFDQNSSFPELPEALALPELLSSFIKKATSFYPQSRYRSWRDVLDALDSISDALGLSSSIQLQEIEKRSTRRFSTQELRPGAGRAVGLTHTNIKIDKKFKLMVPKKKQQQMGDTIAKLSSVPRFQGRSSSGHSSPPGSAQKKGSDRLMIFRIIGGLLLLALMIPLLVYLLSGGTSPQPGAGAPVGQATAGTPPEAATAAQASKKEHVSQSSAATGPKAKYLAMIKAAEDFEKANPDAIVQLIKKYEEAGEYAFQIKDFSLMDDARDKINKTVEKRNDKIASIMASLDKEAEPLIAAGKIEGACNIYLNYAGPLADEFKDKRKLTADKISIQAARASSDKKFNELQAEAKKLFASGLCTRAVELLDSYQGEFAEETAPARKKLAAELKKQGAAILAASAPLMKEIVPPLCRLDTAKLLALIEEGLKNTSVSPAKTQLESMAAEIEKFKALDEFFLAEMQGNLKKTVTLSIANRKETEFSVIEVKTGSVLLKSGEQQIQVWFKDLALDTKLALASKKGNIDELPLLYFLLALQSSDTVGIKDASARLPLNLDMLVPAELREIIAREEFEKMLDSCGLVYDKTDYNNFVAQMTKKEFTATIAAKLLTAVEDFKDRFGTSKFAEKHKGTLENIEKNCRRAGAVIAQKLVIDQDYLKKNGLSFADILEKAQISTVIEIKKGSYSLGGTLSVSKTGLKLIGEEGVEFLDGSLKITGERISVSGLNFRKGRLEVASANDLRIENCQFHLTESSAVKGANRILMDNCFFKGLSVSGSKDIELNHCTVYGKGAVADKANAALYFTGEELSASNCVFYGETYAIVVSGKSDKRKLSIVNSVIYGESGAGVEFLESGSFAKTVAKTEAVFRRYGKSSKNIFSPPQFISAADGNYALIKDTPGVGSGADGKDCGALIKMSNPTPEKEIKK